MRNIDILVSEREGYWAVSLDYKYGTPLTTYNEYHVRVRSEGPTAIDAIMNLCKTLKKQKKELSPYLVDALFKPLEKL